MSHPCTFAPLQDVEGVGQEGDVLRVRHGFARNILIPSKKAVPGTTKNIELYGKRVLVSALQDVACQSVLLACMLKQTAASFLVLVQSSDIKQAHGVVEVAAEALDREVEAVLKRLATHPIVSPHPTRLLMTCTTIPLQDGGM